MTAAHDFWLEAAPFYTEPGETVQLSILVGNEFVGESMPNIVSWYTDFSIHRPDSKVEVDGELGNDPAGRFKPLQPGTHVIGYQSSSTYTEIDSDTFNKYLREEGLQHAIEYRADNGESAQPGKEHYIRHAKLLVQAGDRFEVDHFQLRLGYDLEILPLQNPYKKTPGESLDVQVLYHGQPASDLLVIAFSRNNPQRTQQIRSDHQGMARLRLDDTGPWLVKAVKILRLAGDKADWRSHWASLTFAVRDR